MADGRCIDGTENDVVELEAMRKDSFSWHPCQVSLCSTGLGLIVQYRDNYVEEMVADKNGVLARIRVRSSPLQGDDCSFLQQGDHVLATQNSLVKAVFYDARVEEVTRVRHSKRIHCRCSFRIRWLHQALEGEAPIVPASAIMKLATNSINLHPTISTFFSMLEASNRLDKLPSSTIADSMNWEMDINVLLQKQIEEISNSADVSQKKISNNFLLGLKVDLIGQNRSSAIDVSFTDPCVTVSSLNKLKVFTESENEEPMETTHGNPAASVQDEFTGSRSPLNPLAARAALASLRSKVPQNAELSSQSNMKKGVDDFPLEVSATLGDISPKFEGIVKTLFPTSSAPQIDEFSNVPPKSQKKEMEKKTKNSAKKITQPSERRLTRSQIQKNNGVCESAQVTYSKEIQLELSSKTRRLTRSSTKESEKTEVKESNGASEGNMPSTFVKLDTAAKDTRAPQNCSLKDKKPVSSPIDGENGILGRDGMIHEVEPNKMTITKDTKIHNFPKRVTRLAARAETGVDLSERKVSPESNRSELEIPIISPVSTKISQQFSEERRKTRGTSSHVRATPSTPANVVESTKGVKRKSDSSKMERRFSPRLRYAIKSNSEGKS